MKRKNLKKNGGLGLTLIESIVVIVILFILILIVVLDFRFLLRKTDLDGATENIINTLRLAQSKTLASEKASKYGVYFEIAATPHQYTLFKGNSYTLRDSSFDEVYKLPNSLEIYEIDLGSGTEVVFDRILGTTNQPGDISLRPKADTTKTKTIYIENSGRISLVAPSSPADSRLKDSRHVHFGYSRFIDTSSENLILTFSGGVVKNIIIADNLKDDQIYWEGEVDVGAEIQKIKIHTHRLNNPDTLFSIHRNREENNKSLEIKISGDSSGYLLNYSDDGLFTSKTSIFASEPEWQ